MYGLRPLVASPTGPFRAPTVHTTHADRAGVTCDRTGADDPGLPPLVAGDDERLIAAGADGR